MMKSKILKPTQAKLQPVLSTEGGYNYIQGYGSVFGNVDAYGEVVEPGAFKKTIKESVPAGKVKFVDYHNGFVGTDYIVGVVEEATEDEYGLLFKARLSRTQKAQDILTKVQEGILDALSIGYSVVKEREEENVTYLEELKLYEISIVAWGANDLALVTDAKGLDSQIQYLQAMLVEYKEGRVLSSANRTLLEQCHKLLGDVLGSTAEAETVPEDETQKSIKDTMEGLVSFQAYLKSLRK